MFQGEMDYAFWLGVILLVWVFFDLVSGSVWAHRKFERKTEPAGYWVTVLVWFLIAVSCFFW